VATGAGPGGERGALRPEPEVVDVPLGAIIALASLDEAVATYSELRLGQSGDGPGPGGAEVAGQEGTNTTTSGDDDEGAMPQNLGIIGGVACIGSIVLLIGTLVTNRRQPHHWSRRFRAPAAAAQFTEVAVGGEEALGHPGRQSVLVLADTHTLHTAELTV